MNLSTFRQGVGGPDSVDDVLTDTVFQLASLSKSSGWTAVAELVGEANGHEWEAASEEKLCRPLGMT